ncbi:hypothetical protein BZA70DRAFT_265272 [Myxozyma melibiosi]|uniref:Uncharacterized protein n=1 Tax=Myxozyma melibiosi TaxID=54550 RepID=A0ABR1FDN3_9ASCO
MLNQANLNFCQYSLGFAVIIQPVRATFLPAFASPPIAISAGVLANDEPYQWTNYELVDKQIYNFLQRPENSHSVLQSAGYRDARREDSRNAIPAVPSDDTNWARERHNE